MQELPEFKSFQKIQAIGKLYMTITQKLHGTNAQILIREGRSESQWAINAGSRTRWLTPEDDNYGFCKWVYANKDELVAKLGEGTHYGEWCGKGINSGEGLEDKRFCLFNWRRHIGSQLPRQVCTVPVLYQGVIDMQAIDDAMQKLKTQGSMLVPGYMHPEGIIIELDGQLYKKVFVPEETAWTKAPSGTCRAKVAEVNINYLFQPLRLEKLLSKDERLTREFPNTIGEICKAYVADLEAEAQFKAATPEALAAEKKALGKQVFYFIKAVMAVK